MKEDQFYNNFIQIFEDKFIQTVDQIFTKSADADFDTSLISQFKEPMNHFLEGGKRLRPFLIAVAADSLDDQVIHAGIAFELIHTFALVHDDLMDGATMRRNVPAVHTYFESKGYNGQAGAILLGDYLLIAANEYLAENNPDILPIFMKMQRFLCIGQFYEMIHWGKDIPREISGKISRFKSAQYSFMYPLQIGFSLVSKEVHTMDRFADACGLAFQMRDDWLDISDLSQSGKDKNLDIKNGVPNIVQNIHKQHHYDIDKTRHEIDMLLANFKKEGMHEIDMENLSTQQKESLIKLLQFCTTI